LDQAEDKDGLVQTKSQDELAWS